jgi:BirA family biotin operon repressor/biotin-[acetyl-CoA-carboxylase] ligase
MSIVLTPVLPAGRLGLLPLAAGAGVARALDAVSGKRIGLKWPNDLLVGTKKVGGILLESGVRADRLVWAVAGIGINVATDSRAFPPELWGKATSLAAEGVPPLAREVLFARILAEVLPIVRGLEDGGAEVLAEFRNRDVLAGRTVRIDRDGALLVGVAEGITEEGALRVRAGDDTLLVHHGTILSFEP